MKDIATYSKMES